MDGILEVRNLVKHYPAVTAVDNISFTIPEGGCFGLLGPNGAGKTTTIEIIEDVTKASSGTILYKHKPRDKNFRQQAGIQFQATALQDHLTVRNHLTLFSNLYKKKYPLENIIEECALHNFLDQDARKLSGGQRQRLLLAIALLNDPEIVILDEPTTGLDPQARRSFWELIEKIKARNKTIILTTHYMEEAYQLCDNILIMDHGRIIASGTPSSLLADHFDEVALEIPIEDFTINTKELVAFTVLNKKHTVEILTSDVNTVLNTLLSHKVCLNRLEIRKHNLEDLFLKLTGKELRV